MRYVSIVIGYRSCCKNWQLRNIFSGGNKESMVYVCGHYHMLGGAVPNMYTLQQAGFLELELADWKDNRM